jgi:mRNA interferase MazF
LSSVTVALVTGTPGPDVTHVRIGPETGPTKYAESFVNCTDLIPLDEARLHHRLGRLALAEMRSIESAVRVILGL